jgi:WD40 repeat protein
VAAGWKTVRVFISSTFRDMHRERDHLVRVVFPELKERCRTIHVQLVDVDLRWGVTEADFKHGKALDICLDEIDGCRPYFLGILGHRYGFVPEGHRQSITAQEIYHGVLHGNLPKQVVDLRKILEDQLEGQLEGHALSTEQKDCLACCYSWDADKRKYLLQEEVALGDAEIIRSVFERYSIYQNDRSFFLFRSETLSRQLAGTKTSDFFEQDQDKVESLKEEIVHAGLAHFPYADIEAFGQLVLDTLWKRIEAEAELAPGEERDWLGQEAELHELFMADRTRRFVGRRDLLDRMHGFCNRDEDPSLLVIAGEPGCGKSALMARFNEEALRQHPDWLILGHFVGASPSSTSLRQMLRCLCTHLNRAAGATEDEPEDIRELLKLFPELLTSASKRRKVLIIIDAVNQLEQLDHAHSMHWLPQMLPKNVRVVISTLKGEAHDAMLQRRIKPREETVTGLSAAEIRELAGTYLREIRHEFPDPDVEREFYRKVEKGNPLYILVALEELRVFGEFEELGARINRLPDNVPALFDQVLERIESDFNPALVGDCMSYIACGRHGMTAEELQTLLKAHAPRIDPNSEAPKLPDMLWSRLYRSLSAYLFERSGVIDFFHGQLKDAVGKRYLQKESSRDAAHCAIAGYLNRRWRDPYARALDELPHQQMRARNGQALVEILCDLQFIELKCQAAMTYDLGADYESALSSEGVPVESRSDLDDFARFVYSQSHVLARKAALTFQQAANEPDSTAPARVAHARMEAGLEARPWIQYINKPQSRSACLMTLAGHTDEVAACAFSADGSRIVSASRDKTLKLWDAQTGAELATLEGHTEAVLACAFSADDSRIVSASADDTLKLWDAQTGAELATLQGHTSTVWACAFSADGSRVVSGSGDKTLKLWEAQTGAELATLEGHTHWVTACAFSPDGSRIVSGSPDFTLKLWDAQTGTELTTLAGHDNSVTVCAFSADGSQVVSASWDSTLKLWDAKTGAELFTLAGHESLVNACTFSPDGTRIVSASDDNTLKLWDAKIGAELATLTGHTSSVEVCAFSPDGRRIVSGSGGLIPASVYTLKLWDAETGTELATFAGHTDKVSACAFSPDGRRIVSASEDNTLRLWEAKTQAELATIAGHRSSVRACAFSPDSSRVVSASDDYTLKLWDARTGIELTTLAGHRFWVQACAFSPDGNCIVSASYDSTLKLWDAQTGAELTTLTGHTWEVKACAFSPDGRRIVSASWDSTLRLWDAQTGAELRTLGGHPGMVNACAFSPDGSRIVSASGDDTLKLWDAQTLAELVTLEGHTHSVMVCAFSPDGRCIVSASVDGTFKLWDAQTGAELGSLEDSVTACAFSPDGNRIVSASGDKTLKLWDARIGVQIWEYELEGNANATAWSPNGGELAVGDSLGRLLILRLQNFSFDPVFVTAWQHNPRRWGFWKRTDLGLHFGCPLCRVWSEVPASALGAVIPCPHCGGNVELNPFTINADWRPIAAAWKVLANDE